MNYTRGSGEPLAKMSHYLQTSRDMTLASGSATYTGLGLTPRTITAFAFQDGNSATSFGMSTDLNERAFVKYGGAATTQNQIAGSLIYLAIDATGTNAQGAAISSLDPGELTLAWTKIGTPTGTMRIDLMIGA
jgi:hypothetical protein